QKFPEGRLTTTNYAIHEIGAQQFVAVEAAAYRTPDDPVPGVGLAWEPVPGKTNFTRDSELMNAETSAWGRAIVALGFETKYIASANEVRNRQYDEKSVRQNGSAKPNPFATLGGALKSNGYTMRDV